MIAREPVVLPAFAREVEEGITGIPKTLPSKLFYDATGSALFEEITCLPEYYLTRTELALLAGRRGRDCRGGGPQGHGGGTGGGTATKTLTLLEALTRRQIRVAFFPVDISPNALAEARDRVTAECSRVSVRPVVADFSEGFSFLRDIGGRRLVLYLGSSIGNFDPGAAVEMLRQVHSQLSAGDALLLGTDLAKIPSILVPAYDDAQGITARFNKNILQRLNRDLEADFDLDSFRHLALWNPIRSRMEIYLESLATQIVRFRLLQLEMCIYVNETTTTENSYKYTMPMVQGMLGEAGFKLERTWFDARRWFALHLARV